LARSWLNAMVQPTNSIRRIAANRFIRVISFVPIVLTISAIRARDFAKKNARGRNSPGTSMSKPDLQCPQTKKALESNQGLRTSSSEATPLRC